MQLQAVLPDPRIKQQLHMRCIVDLMALRIRQDSQIGRKDDVVAAAAPAAEWHILGRRPQPLQPVAALAHLHGRQALRKPRQPGAAMRRGHGDHMGRMARALTGIKPLEPGPHHQTAHAVRNQKRGTAGLLDHGFHASVEIVHHGVDRAAMRGLQRHGHAGNTARLEPAQPDGPHATVAEIAVHQHHAHLPLHWPLHLLALAIHRHSIWLCMFAKRNLPAKQPPGPAPLRQPGPQRNHGGWQRHTAAAQHHAHHQHLRAQLQSGTARNQGCAGQGRPGRARPPIAAPEQQRQPAAHHHCAPEPGIQSLHLQALA
ncbi:hypothetical protein APV28_0293 [Comamonas testosteroni]|nr:hypothetical protein APV28_0293 [Comamonas testosteroni]